MTKVLLLILLLCSIAITAIADDNTERWGSKKETSNGIEQGSDYTSLESDGDVYADEDDNYSDLISEEVLNEIREELMQEESLMESDQQQIVSDNHSENTHKAQRQAQRRKSSGKNNIKAESKLRSASPKKREDHGTASKERIKAQESKGGSYYGGGATFHGKKDIPSVDAQETKERVTGAGKHKQTIESLFSDEMRSKIAESEKAKQEQRARQQYFHVCYATARKYARPVELILKTYNTEDGYVDLYKVLGVSRDIDMFDLKKKYRALALVVHPDKNPHPDAKEAFDAIQDAYVVLSSAAKRKEHDATLNKRARAKSWSLKKVSRAWKDGWYNAKSRALVTWHRCRTGKLKEEWTELTAVFTSAAAGLKQGLLHFALLPSIFDRVARASELWVDYQLYWVSLAVAIGSMIS